MDASPPVRRLAAWDGERLRDLAAEYETPLYILDCDRVRENYRRLAAAFPAARVHYAMKANAGRAALETLAGAGCHVECAAVGELQRALDAGFAPADTLYTAVNPPARDLEEFVALAAEHDGLTVTAGATDTIDRLETLGYTGRLALRITPGVGAGHDEKVTTGADAKFGVRREDAPDIAADAAERGFDVVGIHAHAGSGIDAEQLDRHRAFVERVGETARAVANRIGGLEFVDVGGGFDVPYRPEEPPLDIDAVAAATREALGAIDATLVVEPGRYLVADAGVLLTTVNTVKPERGVVGIDAGMTTLARPALYDAYHHVRSLAPDAGERDERRVTLAGPICESGDVLARDRPLPSPERGDVLAVGNTGAYGIEMASQYNSRPRPAVVALDDGARLVRRRETVADIVATETDR
jgi:diaminopimelate decarboxylase